VPIAMGALGVGACVWRRRLRMLAALCGLIMAATLLVAGGWIWYDMKSMARIQHYEWEGWELALLPGAYAGAVVWVLGRSVLGGYRFVASGRSGSDSGHRGDVPVSEPQEKLALERSIKSK
jgi:TRAP-type C4-dicarboxylate transport system permease small subunit